MIALIEDRRGEASVRPENRRPRPGVVALFVVALLVAAYTGFRLPNEWSATLDAVSLNDGFRRRFLIGTVLRPFAVATGYDYRVFAVASYAVLAATLGVVASAFFRTRSDSRRLVVVAWLLLPTGGFFFHEVGYFDQALYLLFFGAFAAVRKGRLVVATALMALAVTVHEIALLTVIPLFGWVVLRRFPLRRSIALLAPPALLGLVIMAVPPAAPGAVARLRNSLEGANFSYREDALELFERTQSQSWQLYSITDVLLYLVPIALVVIAGFLTLQRFEGGMSTAVLSAAAIGAPLLLAFGGWDEARWGFLLITNFAIVLWCWLGGRELAPAQVGTLTAILLILTHIPMPYFDGYAPRALTWTRTAQSSVTIPFR